MTRITATMMLMIHRVQSMPRRLNTEGCGDVVADEHAADPADHRQPEGNVVPVPRREELAQQADDDACDDRTDDVHRRPLSPVGDGLVPALPEHSPGLTAHARIGKHPMTGFADHCLNTR
jgi:hypothetical protein